MNVKGFLAARIAEDEEMASRVTVGEVDVSDPANPQWQYRSIGDRWLAECKLKRFIIYYFRHDDDWMSEHLYALAALYDDHPDYDPAWRDYTSYVRHGERD